MRGYENREGRWYRNWSPNWYPLLRKELAFWAVCVYGGWVDLKQFVIYTAQSASQETVG